MANAARREFAKLAVLTIIGAFTLVGIFLPPDPATQLWMLGVCTAVGLVGSYWLVYKSAVDLPTLRWGDLFRWYVSTLLLAFLISLVVPDATFAFGSLASRLFQLGILISSGGLVWFALQSD